MKVIIVMACEIKWDSLSWDFKAGPETKARCKRAAQEYHRQEERTVIIVSAGKHPGAVSTATAYLMANCLIKMGVPRESIILGSAPLYTTASELEINLKLAAERNPREAIIISSWYHLPRLWLLTQRFRGSVQLIIKFAPVFKGAKVWRFFREIPRFWVEMAKFAFSQIF